VGYSLLFRHVTITPKSLNKLQFAAEKFAMPITHWVQYVTISSPSEILADDCHAPGQMKEFLESLKRLCGLTFQGALRKVASPPRCLLSALLATSATLNSLDVAIEDSLLPIALAIGDLKRLRRLRLSSTVSNWAVAPKGSLTTGWHLPSLHDLHWTVSPSITFRYIDDHADLVFLIACSFPSLRCFTLDGHRDNENLNHPVNRTLLQDCAKAIARNLIPRGHRLDHLKLFFHVSTICKILPHLVASAVEIPIGSTWWPADIRTLINHLMCNSDTIKLRHPYPSSPPYSDLSDFLHTFATHDVEPAIPTTLRAIQVTLKPDSVFSWTNIPSGFEFTWNRDDHSDESYISDHECDPNFFCGVCDDLETNERMAREEAETTYKVEYQEFVFLMMQHAARLGQRGIRVYDDHGVSINFTQATLSTGLH
jgi:hypothetical protein